MENTRIPQQLCAVALCVARAQGTRAAIQRVLPHQQAEK